MGAGGIDQQQAGNDSAILGVVAGLTVLTTAALNDGAIKPLTLMEVIAAAEEGLATRPAMDTPQFRAVLHALRITVEGYLHATKDA